ncbi:hypothetical protein CDAR_407491 [Caerostris darwini]|uniref:Uncharacterized protein n=1 Tax=Caerostris darwini TaxID=1538125 RepID=A0AAV4PZ63_9ARAC|nr:hypothetical protein CDAR_407491 [Caerostris darwini]
MEMKEITPQSISANARTPRYADAVLSRTAGKSDGWRRGVHLRTPLVPEGLLAVINGHSGSSWLRCVKKEMIKQVLMPDPGASKSLGAVCDEGASFNAPTSENCFVSKPHLLNASAYTLCVKFRFRMLQSSGLAHHLSMTKRVLISELCAQFVGSPFISNKTSTTIRSMKLFKRGSRPSLPSETQCASAIAFADLAARICGLTRRPSAASAAHYSSERSAPPDSGAHKKPGILKFERKGKS